MTRPKARNIKIAAIVLTPLGLLGLITALNVSWTLPLGEPTADPTPNVTHLHGAWHVPVGDPTEARAMVEAAAALGLDFLVITTDQRATSARELESPPGGPLLIPSARYNATPGPLLLLGQPARHGPVSEADGPREWIDGRLRTDAPDFAVAAHPMAWGEGWDLRAIDPQQRRDDREPRPVDGIGRLGIEFISASHMADDESTFPYFVPAWAGWLSLFNKPHAMLLFYDRPDAGLRLWDRISQRAQRPAPGFCAANLRLEEVPPSLGLRTVGTYVLLASPAPTDPEARGEAITEALAQGRSYCAIDLLAPAPGFTFMARGPDTSALATMGQETPLTPGAYLELRAPQVPGTEVRLSIFRDGELARLIPGHRADVALEKPGVYRVEVDIEVNKPHQTTWATWIYSNPITIRPAPEAARP